MGWRIPPAAAEPLNAAVAQAQARGLHVQPLTVAEDGAVQFHDRSQWVVPEFLPAIGARLKDADVLCVGCNTGPDLALLLDQEPRVLHGLEWQPELAMIAGALALLAGHGERVTVWSGDIEDPPSTLVTYDVLYMSGVLYHLRNPWRALAACYRLLKPGGLLALETMLAPPAYPDAAVQFFPQSTPADTAKGWNYPNYFCPTAVVVERLLGLHHFEAIVRVPNTAYARGAFVARRPGP